mmetsp:Transcript_8803/g.23825  ORF Transcript_8803/g.23825 Transcript_8803/m.23825 type:complete len:209 (-) Transcript_8803:730-1356(-)
MQILRPLPAGVSSAAAAASSAGFSSSAAAASSAGFSSSAAAASSAGFSSSAAAASSAGFSSSAAAASSAGFSSVDPSPSPSNTAVTSAKTSSTLFAALTVLTFPSPSYFSMTGMDCSVKVIKRFLMLSRLSSDLPLVLPRSSKRPSSTSSGQSKKSTKLHEVTFSSKSSPWSRARGKPSMRYLSPSFTMAFFRRLMVISLGTIFPSRM